MSRYARIVFEIETKTTQVTRISKRRCMIILAVI